MIPQGMSIEMAVHAALRSNPNSTSSQLAERMGEVPIRVTRSLYLLHQKGLIEREKNSCGGPGLYQYRDKTKGPIPATTSPRESARRPHRRRRSSNAKDAAKVLVMVEYGRNQCVDLTMDEARAIFRQLHGLFAHE